MKNTIFSPFVLVAICCLALFVQGCAPDTGGAGTSTLPAERDAHAALHQSKHGGVIVEFPGHKYALEVIDDETTGLVTAFLTDAHFAPITVDTQAVQLNFMVDGAPKTYTLSRIETVSGKPATFTFTDAELANLICDGWQGEATAVVEISGSPYSAKLISGEQEHVH